MSVFRGYGVVLLSISLLAALGFFLPRWLIGDGVERFRNDPAKHRVAVEAHQGAWLLHDNPIGRMFTPAARVVSVTRSPGHCPEGPGSDQPDADYQARVRFYTFFGIPAGTVYITCGGWSWSRYPAGNRPS